MVSCSLGQLCKILLVFSLYLLLLNVFITGKTAECLILYSQLNFSSGTEVYVIKLCS